MTDEIKFRIIEKSGYVRYATLIEIGGMDDSICDEIANGKVSRYTGLKDKNGKDVYEHDILSDGAVVEWFDNLGWDGDGSLHPGFYCKKWAMYYREGDNIDMSFHFKLNDPEIEVIGNIHQNPELAK